MIRLRKIHRIKHRTGETATLSIRSRKCGKSLGPQWGETKEKVKDKGTVKEKEKGKQRKAGRKAGRGEPRRENVLPPPDPDDPMVKMQNRKEIFRSKCDRKIFMGVSKELFLEIVRIVVVDKTGHPTSENHRIAEEAVGKAFLLYIQAWLIRRTVGHQIELNDDDTEEQRDRKLYVVKISKLPMDMQRCEI